jgi:hypothetical protein
MRRPQEDVMKKWLTAALLVLALIPCAARVEAIGIGFGAFGGANFPVLMDNADPGTIWGLRAPVRIVPLLQLEPFWATSTLGDVTKDFGVLGSQTIDGGKFTSYGINAALTSGGEAFNIAPYVGIGSGTYKHAGGSDLTNTVYDAGLSFMIKVLPFTAVDIRGEFDALVNGDTSRKFATLTAGLTYRLPVH